MLKAVIRAAIADKTNECDNLSCSRMPCRHSVAAPGVLQPGAFCISSCVLPFSQMAKIKPYTHLISSIYAFLRLAGGDAPAIDTARSEIIKQIHLYMKIVKIILRSNPLCMRSGGQYAPAEHPHLKKATKCAILILCAAQYLPGIHPKGGSFRVDFTDIYDN